MPSHSSLHYAAAALLLLGTVQVALAHGDETETSMKMDMAHGMGNSTMSNTSTVPTWEDFEPSYFRYGQYSTWMLVHILTMLASWILIMPVAIMLSIARSRYHLPAQLTFHMVNGLGIFTGFIYNHSTPDLYVVNAHHTMGWVLQALAISWTLLSFCSAYNDWLRTGSTKVTSSSRPLLSPMSTEREHMPRYADRPSLSRYSQDSGNFSASRESSSESVPKKSELPSSPTASEDVPLDDYETEAESRRQGFVGSKKVDRILQKHAGVFTGTFAAAAIRLAQIVIEKFLLLLGFTTLVTGFVTYGGIFRGGAVFSGAAHYVKGAIFFWYGLLTLGRWMGAFGEFGWAWNLRPGQPHIAKWKTRVPSAEFTESFVIWLYGASNVFLEHLGSSSAEFSAQDFEHISITILFFGGGLLGMLIEQRWLRDLMSTQVLSQKSEHRAASYNGTSRLNSIYEEDGREPEEWLQHKTESISLNPMPALTIMLLGMMMSSHHQLSMVSTMMHKSWGTLFSGFAMARLVTYVLMYMKPPTSHFPARPPSELIAAFCLISGGIMFMNSASDSVKSIETNGLDAMTIFTITMGLTGLIMAWEMICYALKGWAVRKESLAATTSQR